MPDHRQLIVAREPIAHGCQLRLRGELDLATAPVLDDHLRELHADGGGRLVLDMGRLSFMDCFGLRVIVAAARHARDSDSDLEVICPAGQVRRVFALTGMDRHIKVTTSTAASHSPADRPISDSAAPHIQSVAPERFRRSDRAPSA